MTAREIAEKIFYSPATNNKATESIDKGEDMILKFAKEYNKKDGEVALPCGVCGGTGKANIDYGNDVSKYYRDDETGQ